MLRVKTMLLAPLHPSLSAWGFLLACTLLPATASQADAVVDELDAQFARQVDHRLDVPVADQRRTIGLVQQALLKAHVQDLSAQTFLVVDRNPFVQAAFLVLRTGPEAWHWVGAVAVSTGRPGGFAHFISPLGVFLHSPANPDFRADGTYNKNHIRGYGVTRMRVFDFGWQTAQRGWGAGGHSPMRLAMHATDPERLEALLGTAASEGCIRIPASLNHFLDHYGVLDADYEAAQAQGKPQRVLLADRQAIAWPGRYMVIIDSQALERPSWSFQKPIFRAMK